MNRRYAIYFGLIALLVAANLARVWLDPGKGAEETGAQRKAFLPDDFRLHVDLPAAGEPRRNLFQPAGMTKSPRVTPNHARQGNVVVVTQAPIEPENNEAELAVGRLGKLKLLGVVFRAGKGQVYLAHEKENVIAFAGDTVFGQFVVDKLTVGAVELRDLKTNTMRRIPLSGK